MERYKPSKYVEDVFKAGGMHPCTGLSEIVACMNKQGYSATISYGDDLEMEKIGPFTVSRAVHEADEVKVCFLDDFGRIRDWVLVIAGNDEDWLTDHTMGGDLEKIIDRIFP